MNKDIAEKVRANIALMSLEDVRVLANEFLEKNVELELQKQGLSKQNTHLLAIQDKYKKIVSCSPVPMLVINKQGYITEANKAICELLVFLEIELLGTRLNKYIYVEDQQNFQLFLKELQSSVEMLKLEVSVKRSYEDLLVVVFQGCKSKNDEYILVLQNINEQKKVEEAIYQLNEQLKVRVRTQKKELQANLSEIEDSKHKAIIREAILNSVFNSIVEGFITINQAGFIESINNSITTIFGYQEDELIGKNVTILMPENVRKQYDGFLVHYLKMHKSKIIGKTRQLEGQRKKGSIFPLDLSVSEYKVDNQSHFIGVIRDCSDRVNKEVLVKKHLDELAHVTRLGLMGEMAAGIAHEVNQPLAAIATYSQVCLKMLQSEEMSVTALEEVLTKTEKQACRAGQLISHMRSFVSSKQVYRSRVDIHDLIRNAMELAADECKQFSIKCNLELAESLPLITVDDIQIEQVLLNLLKNAIDVLAKKPKGESRILSIQSYVVDNKYIEIRVKDNGPGINEQEKAKIFTPFFTTKSSGMGMGLSICQSLIISHGGQLRFNSAKSKGTTFYFNLPSNGY